MEDIIYDLFLRGENIFLHGAAGTGKTHAIRQLVDLVKKTNQESLIIAAPTGLAATHINGSTIHSQFGVTPFNIPEKLLKYTRQYDNSNYDEFTYACDKSKTTEDLNNIEKLHEMVSRSIRTAGFSDNNLKYLIIDEISMTGAVLFTILDGVLREKFNRNLPMGGVQCVFSGDFCQLPPVKDEYCCFTPAWQNMDIKVVNMVDPKRYKSGSSYFDFICRLRVAKLNTDDQQIIRSRLNAFKNGDHLKLNIEPIMLYPTNDSIDNRNNQRLKEIVDVEYVFQSADVIKLSPNLTNYEKRKYQLSASKSLDDSLVAELHIKVGAQIIFIVNYDATRKLVNGRMCKIIAITRIPVEQQTAILADDTILADGIIRENCIEAEEFKPALNERIIVNLAEPNPKYLYSITVQDIDGHEFVINPHTATGGGRNYTYSRIQFPFKLAWAISIHRSQGMSVDAAIIDIGNSFCPGQSYVAISRVATLDGLFISRVNLKKIWANKEIVEYFNL
jgi:hypothetical protein